MAAPICLALGVAGCSTDDIQFNGGIFDMVGLSDATKTKSGEPKMAERAPLVVPPALDRLPPPGEAPAQNSQLAAIKDHDAEKNKTKEQLKREQAEYCKVHYENAMVHGDDASVAHVEGPLGPCRKSILTAIQDWNEE